MAALATQISLQTGIIPTKNAVSASDTFTNDGKTFLHVVNGNAATCTVTIVTSETVYGLAVADQTVAILTTAEAIIGPFPTDAFGTTTTVTFSVTPTVTCQVIRINAVR